MNSAPIGTLMLDAFALPVATFGPGPDPLAGTLTRTGADPTAGTLSRTGPDPTAGTLARP